MLNSQNRGRIVSPAFALAFFTLLLALGSCTDSRPNLGEAYVAPATLHLRRELSSKSSSAGELKHGDHVLIVDVQRRMVRVRTDKGIEGWVDSLQLLSPEQMQQLTQRRQENAAMPPEGSATAFEVLNVHIEPDRQSPAFTQIPEGGAVTVLGHRITPKNTEYRGPAFVVAKPQTLTRKQRKDQQARSFSFRLPPKPAPPKPPANWQQLSAERIDGGSNESDQPVAKQASPATKQALPTAPSKPMQVKPPVLEDWTLIRTKHNETGWVLSRNLLMSIPDDVAQYAEGKHITAFFDLGQVNDELKGPRHNWLWTTASYALPFDFDSWRVFLWNSHHHRYETSYRQRDLEGYFPVHVEPPDLGSPLRTFALVTKDDDGKMRRRTYTFDGHLVHLANTENYDRSTSSGDAAVSALNPKDLASKAAKPGWFKRQWSNLKQRIFGS